MTGLILEIQRDALDKTVSVTDLLRKALAASKKLGIGEIEEWLGHELNGYPDMDQAPKYREVQGQLKAWNPYQGFVPINAADPEFLEHFTKSRLTQSVSELEALTSSTNGTLRIDLPPEAVNLIMKAMNFPLQPSVHLPASQLVGVLNTIRNSVLQWALDLEAKGVKGEGMSFSNEEKAAANQATYQTITNIGVMNQSQLQQHSPSAQQTLEVGVDSDALVGLVQEIRACIDALALDQDKVAELKSELQTLQAQAESPKPKTSIIRETLKSVRSILENTAAAVVAQPLLVKLAVVLAPFG